MAHLQPSAASTPWNVGNLSAAVCLEGPGPGASSTWSAVEYPLIPAAALRGQLQRFFERSTASFEVGDEPLWLASGTAEVTTALVPESGHRGRRITLGQARQLALSALKEADERWQRAVDAEAQFLDEMLETLEGDGE